MKEPQMLLENDHLLMLAVLRLGEDAYAVPLCQELTVMTGRPAALASVYKAAERLELLGMVVSHMGEPSAVRGGRAKRYLRVTAEGMRAIQQTRDYLNRLWQVIPAVGEG